jgi:hypothetical protein
MYCPELEKYVSACPVKKCMHNIEGECQHKRVLECVSSKASVKIMYSVTESQIDSSVENIRLVLTLDKFCYHLLGRGLEEILVSDINLVKVANVQYAAWTHFYKPDFNRLINCLTLVSAKL